jgi:hypothetical protein
MKKKIAIFALVAIFVSVGSLTAQTKSVTTTKTTTVVKVDKKSATPACCIDKKSKCCKGKTAAQKAECVKKCNKATAKTGTKTCTQTKKAVTKKI